MMRLRGHALSPFLAAISSRMFAEAEAVSGTLSLALVFEREVVGID